MDELDPTDAPAADFIEHRGVLVGVAYRVLGSMTSAEDVVQEAWLRWREVDRDSVQDPRAYLIRITTRLAINELRSQRRRREEYVGPWLPEPVGSVPGPAPSAEASVELAEDVSLAMLVVLESLSPLERAAFILREVFGESFEDIAATLDRRPAAVRQLVHRARNHVSTRAPRHPVDRETHQQVAQALLDAVQGGSLEQLLTLLSPDVVLVSDGGGKRSAALRPVRGAEKVLRFIAGILGKSGAPQDFRMLTVNGEPALGVFGPEGLDTIGTIQVDDGVVTYIFLMRNPDKLRHATAT